MKTSYEDIAMTTSPAYSVVQTSAKWVTRRHILKLWYLVYSKLDKPLYEITDQEPTEHTSQQDNTLWESWTLNQWRNTVHQYLTSPCVI